CPLSEGRGPSALERRANGRPEEPADFNGRRQSSVDGTSRMNREVHVRICERLGVKLPGPTRQIRTSGSVRGGGGNVPTYSAQAERPITGVVADARSSEQHATREQCGGNNGMAAKFDNEITFAPC